MQTICHPFRWRAVALRARGARAALVLVSAGWFAPAAAATGPVNRPSAAPVQEELVPDLPDFPVIWHASSAAPLQLFSAHPFGPDDKGGTYTDMGTGQPGHLTAREHALLALGRTAVEASRAAGTLEMRRAGLTTGPRADEDIARRKQESLLRPPAGAPVLGTGSPADLANRAGVSAPIPAGPVALTPAELEKLAATATRRERSAEGQ